MSTMQNSSNGYSKTLFKLPISEVRGNRIDMVYVPCDCDAECDVQDPL